jgi:two-component system sensor histidine kinase KdpD
VTGRLHVYLGAAPGVGKTFAALTEGERLADAGTDVVVGLVETHDRSDTAALVRHLEAIPRREVIYRGARFGELDVEGVLIRHPDVVIVDELAHTNIPGSRNEKRWQDVGELLDEEIDVITCMNVQHVDSLNDAAEKLTGLAQRETVPDDVIAAADRIDLVDIDPEALRARVARGEVHVADAAAAVDRYFAPENLAALRNLALKWLADRGLLDGALGSDAPSDARADGARPVVAALTGTPEGEHLVRRAAQIAAEQQGELVGLHVRSASGLVETEPAWLERQRRLLVELGGRYAEIAGEDVAGAVLEFARAEGAAHLVLGSTRRSRRYELMHGSVINRAIRHAGPVEVHIVPSSRPARQPERIPSEWRGFRPRLGLPGKRRLAAWVLAVVAPVALTIGLVPFRSSLGVGGDLLCVLLAVVAVAVVGGVVPAFFCMVLGFLLGDYYFTVPLHSFRVDHLIDIVALVVFAVVALVVGALVDVLSRQGVRVAGAQAEAEGLARLLAASVPSPPEVRSELTSGLRRAFSLDSVAVLRRDGTTWMVDASAGSPVPDRPEAAPFSAALPDGEVLVLTGERLDDPEAALLRAFVTQLRLQQERAQLARIRGR